MNSMIIPSVWSEPLCDYIPWMENAAAKFFRKNTLPVTVEEWRKTRPKLLKRLSAAIRLHVDRSPLELQVTGEVKRKGYLVKKIYFRGAESRYITGNLYIPDGKGLFPAVLNMHGHWIQGRLAERVQARGHILAQNGYVCLAVDSFGSGERSTIHGKFEPHGGLLGGLLHNFGETLLGIQLADNIRAVDLLCSMPEVDISRIGATGASGGGNQTMYLAAFDERIRAAVPTCNVGTYESYIMGHNCICETIFNGMNICEESALIALAAPRAIKIHTALSDQYSAFTPQEMLRTFTEARCVFRAMECDDKLSYQIFPGTHGYSQEMMESMLGFFAFHLKAQGRGAPLSLPEINYLSEDEAMVFQKGKRPRKVGGILRYGASLGGSLAKHRERLAAEDTCTKLKAILNCKPVQIRSVIQNGTSGIWEKVSLETGEGFLVPLLIRKPRKGKRWCILSARYGKQELAGTRIFEETLASNDGILLLDLFASGERGSEYGDPNQWDFHNTSRSCFWLGHTMLGEWIMDYAHAAEFLKTTFGAEKIILGGNRDAAVAALLAASLFVPAEKVLMENSQLSFDWSEIRPDFRVFTVVLSVPDILLYGDIPTFCALAETFVEIYSPLHGDGTEFSKQEKKSFEEMCRGESFRLMKTSTRIKFK